MTKKECMGMWFFRDGDLLPEEITEHIWRRYRFTVRYCEYLQRKGLLFENREEALMHYKCMMGAMKKPVDERRFDNLVPVWRHFCELHSESGKAPDRDMYKFQEEAGILIKVSKGSFTERYLLLKELEKLPKEKGL